MKVKKNILVVNDDGINSKLVHLLCESLLKYANVFLYAPIEEKSASSHMINIKTYSPKNVFSIQDYKYYAYVVNGSPADCTRYALDYSNVKFDYVFSGINNGWNLREDIYYSGTVSAALEASLRGLKACALSCAYNDNYCAYEYIDKTLELIFEKDLLSSEYLLNINFPKKVLNKDFNRFCHMYVNESRYSNCDQNLIDNGYITFTPIIIDRTDYKYLELLNNKVDLNK